MFKYEALVMKPRRNKEVIIIKVSMVVTFQGRETNEVGTGPQRGIWEVSAFGHMGFTL